MKYECLSVLDMLRRLEQHVGEYHRYSAQVAAALSGGHLPLARDSADGLLKVLDTIVEMAANLQSRVVPADGLGEMMESLPELAIRARRMVIAAQADRLRDVLRGPLADGRARGWFTGRFRHIDHVSDFLANEFYRINCIWMQYRRDERSTASMATVDRVTLYKTALRVAQQAMQALGTEPALSHFLNAGTAAESWPEVQAACMQIVAALAIQIDMDPGGELSGPPSPSSMAHTPAARSRD